MPARTFAPGWKIVLAVCVIAFAAVPNANAQIDRGNLTGMVTDPAGAVVPGARVVAIEDATQLRSETTTGEAGMFLFPALKGGVYTLRVEKEGFETVVRPGVTIRVQDRVRIDIALTVGSVTAEVLGTGGAPLLDTETAQMGKVVGTREVTELPLLGRKYAQLALLASGALQAPADTQDRADSVFNVSGNWATQNMFLLDGVDNNSFSTNLREKSAQVAQPSVEALSEFRIQTRTYDAEFGRNAGAVVNATLKSGTNKLHGSVYEFLRNDAFQATEWAINKAGLDKPGFKQNQFGVSLGGPFYLGSLYNGRNRTFWFFNYEGTRVRKGESLTGSVPTPLMRTGDFTESPYPMSDPDPAFVPASKVGCIVGKVVNPACLDPVAVGLLELYPLPNVRRELEGIPGGYVGNNYTSAPTMILDTDSFSTRFDHTFGNNVLFGHYSFWDSTQLRPNLFYDFNIIADGSGGATRGWNLNRGQHVGINWTRTFTSRLFNELRFGYSRISSHSRQGAYEEEGANERYGILGVAPDSAFGGGLASITTGFTGLGAGGYMPQWQVSWTWQFQDMVSYIFGKHSMKMGVEVRRDAVNYLDLSSPKGRINANGWYTTGGRWAAVDFMLGLVGSSSMSSYTVPRQYWNGLSLFWQDQWRATPKLTVNYGVRYEFFTPPIERDARVGNFNPTGAGSMIYATKSGDLYERTLIHPDNNNFAPRLGLAYSLTPKLVLRAGFGIFYQHQARYGSEGQMGLNPPFLLDIQDSPTWPPGAPIIFLLEDGFPANYIDPSKIDLSKIRIRCQEPTQRTTYVEQGSLTLQYEFAPNFMWEVGYVGNAGKKLRTLRNINQGIIETWGVGPVSYPYPGWYHIQWMTNSATSNYHSMQMKVEKRYSYGLTFVGAWTWGHALGRTDEALGGGFDSPQNAYDMKDQYGPLNSDVRHRLTFSSIYELPWGKDRKWATTGALAAIVGGWQISPIFSLETGRPLTISGGSDRSGTGPGHAFRADCIGDPYPDGFTPSMDAWFDTSAFARPAAYTFGSCGIGTIRGRGKVNLDISLSKRFEFKEDMYLEFRAEAFNAANAVRLANPTNSVTSSTFGRILSKTGDPREFQFALKFAF